MKFNKPGVNFWRVWTKNTMLGNFENIFKKFLQRFVKMLYLINPCVHFSPFGQKTQIVGKFSENFENF